MFRRTHFHELVEVKACCGAVVSAAPDTWTGLSLLGALQGQACAGGILGFGGYVLGYYQSQLLWCYCFTTCPHVERHSLTQVYLPTI